MAVMLLSARFTRKAISAAVVTRRLWVELTVWATAASALKGWQAEWRPGGWRVVTPVAGMGWCFNWREHE